MNENSSSPPPLTFPAETRIRPMHPHKSVRERFFHALAFELLAIAICAPLGAWLLGYSLAHIGLLTLMISLVARALHAVLFEIGLLLAVVPLAAWWLKIGLWEAFVLDIGIALFFLPYTFLFNLAYDHLRARFVAKKIQTVPR